MSPRYRTFAIKLALTGLILFLLFSAVDLGAVGEHITDIPLRTFAVAALCYVVATVVATVRWSVLLRVRAVQVPLRHLLAYNFSYLFYSLVLPGGKVAAEAVRVYQIVRDTNDASVREKVIFPTLLDRAVAVFTYALAALAVFLFVGTEALSELPFWFPYAVATLVVFIVLSVFLPVEKILRPFVGSLSSLPGASVSSSLSDALSVYRTYPLQLSVAVLLSLVMLGSMSAATFFITQALGFSVGYLPVVGVFAVSMIAAFLPLTIAGVGVREGVFAYLFSALTQVPLEAALSISLIALFSSHVSTLVGGLVEFYRHFMRRTV
jgi:uncharacterized protein (TIRG00374 family)